MNVSASMAVSVGVGVDGDCGCRCNMRRSERFDEMRICRVELSCGVGVACAV